MAHGDDSAEASALAHRLFALVEAMAAAQDRDSALGLCCAAAADLAGAAEARIHALDLTGCFLVHAAPRGVAAEPPIPLYPEARSDTAEPRAWCVFSGQPALVPDARHAGLWDCSRVQRRDAEARRKTGSLIALPLRIDDRTVGVLEVSGMPPADVAMLQALLPRLAPVAFQAAAIAANLTLEARNQELAKRLARLSGEAQEALAREEKRRLEAATREGGLIAGSPQMAQALDLLGKVAASPVPVLILGETGTGKEMAARFVHAASPRRDGPFVAQNCAALPAELLESELFGYRRGAFTGATADKPGLFELAEKGTLFLDEIGDMQLPLQAKLLRVLQDGEVRPLGATKGRKLDVRILAATHNDLKRAVAEGRFREDLYYRLAVFPVTLPPLRERQGDALLLARAFLERATARFAKPIAGFAAEAERRIAAYPWPGNVRELQNAVERAAILCPAGGEVKLEHLPPELLAAPPAPGLAPDQPAMDLRETVARTERAVLLKALEEAGGNVSRAARNLGLSRRTMHEKLARLGLARAEARRAAEST